jgi:hypothetical protein
MDQRTHIKLKSSVPPQFPQSWKRLQEGLITRALKGKIFHKNKEKWALQETSPLSWATGI